MNIDDDRWALRILLKCAVWVADQDVCEWHNNATHSFDTAGNYASVSRYCCNKCAVDRLLGKRKRKKNPMCSVYRWIAERQRMVRTVYCLWTYADLRLSHSYKNGVICYSFFTKFGACFSWFGHWALRKKKKNYGEHIVHYFVWGTKGKQHLTDFIAPDWTNAMERDRAWSTKQWRLTYEEHCQHTYTFDQVKSSSYGSEIQEWVQWAYGMVRDGSRNRWSKIEISSQWRHFSFRFHRDLTLLTESVEIIFVFLYCWDWNSDLSLLWEHFDGIRVATFQEDYQVLCIGEPLSSLKRIGWLQYFRFFSEDQNQPFSVWRKKKRATGVISREGQVHCRQN